MARHSLLILALLGAVVAPGAARAQTLTVHGDLQQAIADARPGDRLLVPAGVYRAPVVVTVPNLTLEGRGNPELTAEGHGSAVTIVANGVTLEGFHVTDTGRSLDAEDAGVKLLGVKDCRVLNNTIDQAFFGVVVERSSGNHLSGNRITGAAPAGLFEAWGDGVRLWNAEGNRLDHNDVSRFRDGLYMEFAAHSTLEANVASHNQRYGLHFMYMDDSTFTNNRFDANQAGSVLMYSKRLRIVGNTFSDNRGSVGDGLLFKENDDSVIAHNRLVDNTVGMFLDSSYRNRFEHNLVAGNGWGLLLYASATGNRFTGNAFIDDGYEVAVDMPRSDNVLDGNYWSGYRGYDLNGDGRGDTSYAPVTLFAYLGMQYPDLVAFSQSPAVHALDFAQKLLPALAPSSLRDDHPLISAKEAS
ncbi:MAG TPA: nitrous oxide reductase family maturation protein NosD [Oscillatoriaceae cyanobacterium]